MEIVQIIAKAISKIWSFVTAMILIAVVIAFVIIILTVLMPDNVLQAVDIITGWLTEVGIVGSG
jgi:hypothetical protein